jgi:hypothetical protein
MSEASIGALPDAKCSNGQTILRYTADHKIRNGLWIGDVAAASDFEALGLLDGLEGTARDERAQLIRWLLDQGFSIEHICGSAAAPLMLPASKVLGDDGRPHQPAIDDPDAAVSLRADGYGHISPCCCRH